MTVWGSPIAEGRLRPRRRPGPLAARLQPGTCHGSAQGKNGFKLSLRGYDPLFDVRALTDDHASRRVNVASPDDSLMLLKPTGAVPHVGGGLDGPGEPYYEILRSLDRRRREARPERRPGSPRSRSAPINPVVQRIGAGSRSACIATYADGEVRDVTREAFVESGNTEVATATVGPDDVPPPRRGADPRPLRGGVRRDDADRHGRPHRVRLGAAAGNNKVDELVAAKWQRMKIQPSGLCTDAEFLRRVYLDLTGLPPTAEDVRSSWPTRAIRRVKRDELVDKLDRQPGIRRVLDEQVGRPAPGQPQVPGRRGLGRVPQVDPRPGRREHAL